MSTMSLEAVQTDLIRQILNVSDIHILSKVKQLLRREEKETTDYPMMMAEERVPYKTKAEVLADFGQACKELKLNLEGKLEFKSLEEALDEL